MYNQCGIRLHSLHHNILAYSYAMFRSRNIKCNKDCFAHSSHKQARSVILRILSPDISCLLIFQQSLFDHAISDSQRNSITLPRKRATAAEYSWWIHRILYWLYLFRSGKEYIPSGLCCIYFLFIFFFLGLV